MKPISPLPLGISTSFWFIIGFIRAIHEQLVKLTNRKKTRNVFKKQDIAVIVPAHNEEKVIGKNLRALSRILDKRQIFVASDGSTDKTYEIAKKNNPGSWFNRNFYLYNLYWISTPISTWRLNFEVL